MPALVPFSPDDGVPWLGILFSLPAAAALLLTLVGRETFSRRLALAASLANVLCLVPLLRGFDRSLHAFQFVRVHAWMPHSGASYAVGVDGPALTLLALSVCLMPLCILAAWPLRERVTLGMACLLVAESALVGVFIALDFALLSLCWTGLLAPLALLLALWGGPRGGRAAVVFSLTGFAAAMALLSAGVALAREQGTFFIPALLGACGGPHPPPWIFWALLFGCGMSLPLVPLHGRLPAALDGAGAAAMPFVALLPLLGIHGLLRLCLPLAPDDCLRFSGPMMGLGAAGLVLGGFGALGASLREEPKRVTAGFTTAAMGTAVLALFSGARQGPACALFAAAAQAVTASGLVFCADMFHSGSLRQNAAKSSGFGRDARRAAAVVPPAFFALAGAAFPGAGTFLAVFFALAIALETNPLPVPVALPGLMALAAAMCLMLRQQWREGRRELAFRELLILAPLALAALWLGQAPQCFWELVQPAADMFVRHAPEAP